MPRRVTRIPVVLATVLALSPGVGAAAKPGVAHPAGLAPARSSTGSACPRWSLGGDFRVAPKERNPNPDRCGGRRVWSFLHGGRSPATYALLAQFIPDAFGVRGLEQWQGPHQSGGPTDKLPAVGINATGSTQVVRGITWPARSVRVHPWINDHVVVGWRSPITGDVHFAVVATDLDPGCGDGVEVAVRVGTRDVASDRVLNGGTGRLRGTVEAFQGRFVYFVVGNGGRNDFGCDSTGLSVRLRPVS